MNNNFQHEIGQRAYSFESLSELEERQPSCDGCKYLNCHSIHGPVTQNCLVKGCYSCADLTTIDDEISSAYQRLFDLVQKREQIIKKTHLDTFIHRVPAEILSSIFYFVKEEGHNIKVGVSWFEVPSQSPQLLVSAVCKRWRDVALGTPQLWTDITVDLMKPTEFQLSLVNQWACRSGALPLNITIVQDVNFDGSELEDELDVLEDCEDVVAALRSLVIRWNDLALVRVTWSYCRKLLHELEESPSIRSFFCIPSRDRTEDTRPIQSQHPLRPKRFYTVIAGFPIPFKWDNLVRLETCAIEKGLLLDVICHAQNLKHCITEKIFLVEQGQFPIPAVHVTNCSLIHLQTSFIANHLTLPSLQHLKYTTTAADAPSLVEFFNRSCPPLQTLILHCDVWSGELTGCLEKLNGITSFSIKLDNQHDGNLDFSRLLLALIDPSRSRSEVLLPNLKELTLILPSFTYFSWVLLGRLFSKNVQADTPGVDEGMVSSTVRPLGRPLLSKLNVYVVSPKVTMDKDTFAHFLAVKKSGVDLDFQIEGKSLFSRMAELYDIAL